MDVDSSMTGESRVDERVYRALKYGITHLEFRPGERLVEDLLSRRYGVSRTPVREALRNLEQEDLIVSREGRGRIIPYFDVSRYQDMYAVQIALEQLTVNLAYNTADPAAIAELREHWEGEFAGTEVLLEGSYAASMIDFTWG